MTKQNHRSGEYLRVPFTQIKLPYCQRQRNKEPKREMKAEGVKSCHNSTSLHSREPTPLHPPTLLTWKCIGKYDSDGDR